MTPLEIKSLLARYDIHPTKRRGQNFLVDARVLKKMVDTAELGSEDHVLEIGPGLGVLTQVLGKRVKKVLAVEMDKNMSSILGEKIKKEFKTR